MRGSKLAPCLAWVAPGKWLRFRRALHPISAMSGLRSSSQHLLRFKSLDHPQSLDTNVRPRIAFREGKTFLREAGPA